MHFQSNLWETIFILCGAAADREKSFSSQLQGEVQGRGKVLSQSEICYFSIKAASPFMVLGCNVCKRRFPAPCKCTWSRRDNKKGNQWWEQSLVRHTSWWLYENMGMFISVGLSDRGLLNWETRTGYKPSQLYKLMRRERTWGCGFKHGFVWLMISG